MVRAWRYHVHEIRAGGNEAAIHQIAAVSPSVRGGGDAEHEAYTAVAWGVGVSHEMMNSRERRLFS